MSENKLYAGNLQYSMASHELQDLFEQFGEVRSANVVIDKETGRSRGFGFVEMATDAAARKAVAALNGKNVAGRDLVVNIARPRAESGAGRRERSY